MPNFIRWLVRKVQQYIQECANIGFSLAWTLVNGLVGSLFLAIFATIYSGTLNFLLGGHNAFNQAANTGVTFIIFSVLAWILIFCFISMVIAPFLLWKKQSSIIASLAVSTPLQILFDKANTGKKFWSLESIVWPPGRTERSLWWEYRVQISNISNRTVKNVSVTTEHQGAMSVRPTDQIFDKSKSTSIDLRPGSSELVRIILWPDPKIQPGMLANQSALEYGPVEITVVGDDVPPTTQTFQFDYQRVPMLFN